MAATLVVECGSDIDKQVARAYRRAFGRPPTADEVRIAKEFLRVNGTPPERFHSVCYFGTGFAEDQQLREIRPEESGAIPQFSEAAAHYLLSQGGLGALERARGGQSANRGGIDIVGPGHIGHRLASREPL